MKNKSLILFLLFFRISFLTLGGGHIMLPFIKKEVVTKKGILSENDFVKILTISQSIPGPMSINLALNVGFTIKGVFGAFVSLLGITLPSLIIISLLTLLYNYILGFEWINYFLLGMKCAFSIILISTACQMIKQLKLKWLNIVLMILVIALVILFTILDITVSFIFYILGTLLIFIVLSLFKKTRSLL
ncbi:MAG: chromate transporter [Erysipelotrichaceae bacterium]|jgi:chromate transporter|nr:chromate transporter [Erysipelotrichaceae bacterium]